jgi:microcin C transport system permease protein
VSIPLGIRKAVRDGSRFDTFTSGLIIVAYAIPGFLFAILLLVLFAGGRYLQIFPLRGLVSDGWEDMTLIRQIADYFWHITLPVLASTISAFAFADAPDEEQLPRRDQEAVRDDRQGQGPERAAGPLRPCLPQRDADRDRGFPGGVPRRLLRRPRLIIETIFSLDGLGRLGFEAAVSRDYPVIFGTLFAFGLIGLVVGILSDLMYVWIDPRIDFETRET